MKICMINELYSPDNLGGTEHYLQEICEELRRKNDVFVICTSPRSNHREIDWRNGVRVYRIRTDNFYSMVDTPRMPFYLKFAWSLRRLRSRRSYEEVKRILAQEKPDLVHTLNLYTLSFLVFKAIREVNIPHVLQLHDCELLCPRGQLLNSSGRICQRSRLPCRLYRLLNRRMLKDKPDSVIAPSQFIMDLHLKEGFFRNTKTRRIFLGVKLPKKVEPKTYETIDILYVGALSRYKGPQVLIKAFKSIKNRKFRLHIVGTGLYYGELKKFADDDKRITFYGFQSNLEKFYSQANIVAVPSICMENSPRVILEAFAYDTPVIASRIGGIPELVRDGINGFLFQVGNINELREKLYSLSTKKLISFGEKISKEKQMYSMHFHLSELRQLYSEILRLRF